MARSSPRSGANHRRDRRPGRGHGGGGGRGGGTAGNAANAADDEDISEIDSDSSLPGLVVRNPIGVVNDNSSDSDTSHSSSDDGGGDDDEDDGSPPPLIRRFAPSRASRSRNNRNIGNGSSSSSSSSGIAETESSTDDGDDEVESDDDEAGMPVLLTKFQAANSSSGSGGGDDSDSDDIIMEEDVPGLACPRNVPDSESSDSGGSDSMPDLLERGSRPGRGARRERGGGDLSSSSSSDSSSSDDDELPRRRQQQQQQQRRPPPARPSHPKGLSTLSIPKRPPPKEKTFEVSNAIKRDVEKEKDNWRNEDVKKMRDIMESFGVELPSECSRDRLVEACAYQVIKDKKKSIHLSQQKNDTFADKSSCWQIRKRLDEMNFDHEGIFGRANLVAAYSHALRFAHALMKDPPMPALHGLSKTPQVVGAWILQKVHGGKMKLVYNSIKDSAIVASSSEGNSQFPAASRLQSGSGASVCVFYPVGQNDLGRNKYEIKVAFPLDTSIRVIGPVPKMSAIAHSPDDGCYAIVENTLHYFGRDSSQWVDVGLPASRIFSDSGKEGVWVYKEDGGKTGSSSRLCYCQKDTKLVNDWPLHSKAIVASDRTKSGLLLLRPTTQGAPTSKLTHIADPNDDENHWREQEIDVGFEHVQAIFDDGTDAGALIHYKDEVDKGWKIASVVFGERGLSFKYNCPKTAKIATAGDGSLWVLKKAGKKGADRSLQFLSSSGGNNGGEMTMKYPAGTSLAGAEF